MANLNETDLWEPGIYQLEEDDPVLGGPQGIDNLAPRQLASRSRYQRLRNVTPWLISLAYPVDAYVSDGGTTWKSIAASTGVKPGTDATKWVRWGYTAAELAAAMGSSVAAHEAKADPHAQYALDSDLAAHAAAANPHPQYATDADLAAHVAAADPHSAYALDTDLAAHASAANPHAQYVRHDAAQGLTAAQALNARSNILAEEAGALAKVQKNAPMFALDTGVANACVVAYVPAITALTDGMVLWFKAKVANTGAATLNVNGLGAKSIVGGSHEVLQGGEIAANGLCEVVWNATYGVFVLVGGLGAALQVGPGWKSKHAVQLGQLLAPIAATNFILGNNTTVTATVSFTAPGPGVLLAFGTRNNSAQATNTNACKLFINGVEKVNDNTVTTMMHVATATTAGGAVSASYQAAAIVEFSAAVMLVFIPNL